MAKKKNAVVDARCIYKRFDCCPATDVVGTFEEPFNFPCLNFYLIQFLSCIYLSLIFFSFKSLKNLKLLCFLLLLFMYVRSQCFAMLTAINFKKNFLGTCCQTIFLDIVVKTTLLVVYSALLNLAQLSQGSVVFPRGVEDGNQSFISCTTIQNYVMCYVPTCLTCFSHKCMVVFASFEGCPLAVQDFCPKGTVYESFSYCAVAMGILQPVYNSAVANNK